MGLVRKIRDWIAVCFQQLRFVNLFFDRSDLQNWLHLLVVLVEQVGIDRYVVWLPIIFILFLQTHSFDGLFLRQTFCNIDVIRTSLRHAVEAFRFHLVAIRVF